MNTGTHDRYGTRYQNSRFRSTDELIQTEKKLESKDFSGFKQLNALMGSVSDEDTETDSSSTSEMIDRSLIEKIEQDMVRSLQMRIMIR